MREGRVMNGKNKRGQNVASQPHAQNVVRQTKPLPTRHFRLTSRSAKFGLPSATLVPTHTAILGVVMGNDLLPRLPAK